MVMVIQVLAGTHLGRQTSPFQAQSTPSFDLEFTQIALAETWPHCTPSLARQAVPPQLHSIPILEMASLQMPGCEILPQDASSRARHAVPLQPATLRLPVRLALLHMFSLV